MPPRLRIHQPSKRVPWIVAAASLAAIAAVFLARLLFIHWDDPRLINYAVTCIPVVLTIVIAFLPDLRKAPMAWRIGIVAIGVIWSILLWKQQVQTGRDQENAMARVLKEANKNSDEQIAKRVATLPGAVADAVVIKMSPQKTIGTVKISSNSKTANNLPPPAPPEPVTSKENKTANEKPAPEDIVKGLEDIKKLIVGQRWGLTEGQLADLSRKMAPYASNRDRGDLITCILGDPDSTKFALALVAAFRNAGWNLTGSGYNQAVFSGAAEGIILKVHSKESSPSGLLELVTTLRQAGIEPIGELDDKVPSQEFQIIVGRKP